MKYLLTTIFLILSINSYSQEERSPRFSCTESDSGEQYLVLIGNSFPQIPELDYSSQLQLLPKKYYLDGTANLHDTFTIKSITENSFETEILDMGTEEIDFGKISLKMDDTGHLIQTFIMPEEHAEFLGVDDTTMTVEFDCTTI